MRSVQARALGSCLDWKATTSQVNTRSIGANTLRTQRAVATTRESWMSFLFLGGRRITYEEAAKMIRGAKQLKGRKTTLVDDSALRNTATVCSWAEMSSMVRGRLAAWMWSDQQSCREVYPLFFYPRLQWRYCRLFRFYRCLNLLRLKESHCNIKLARVTETRSAQSA